MNRIEVFRDPQTMLLPCSFIGIALIGRYYNIFSEASKSGLITATVLSSTTSIGYDLAFYDSNPKDWNILLGKCTAIALATLSLSFFEKTLKNSVVFPLDNALKFVCLELFFTITIPRWPPIREVPVNDRQPSLQEIDALAARICPLVRQHQNLININQEPYRQPYFNGMQVIHLQRESLYEKWQNHHLPNFAHYQQEDIQELMQILFDALQALNNDLPFDLVEEHQSIWDTNKRLVSKIFENLHLENE